MVCLSVKFRRLPFGESENATVPLHRIKFIINSSLSPTFSSVVFHTMNSGRFHCAGEGITKNDCLEFSWRNKSATVIFRLECYVVTFNAVAHCRFVVNFTLDARCANDAVVVFIIYGRQFNHNTLSLS